MRIAVTLLTLMMTFFNGYVYLYILQKENYDVKRLLSKMHRLLILDLVVFVITLCILIPSWAFLKNSNWKSLCYVLSYLPVLALVIYKSAKYYLVRIVYTKRMHRLIIASGCIIILLSISSFFYVSLTSILVLLIPLALPLVMLSAVILKPFEEANNQKYIRKAKSTLSNGEVVKIGITGSYGKTSVKEILKRILSKKYVVAATPGNYNTPLGIARTVSNGIDNAQVFIAEMGARKMGDIQELVDIVDPSIGILTGIAEQHLETFGSVDNVFEEKRKLTDYTKISIVNADNYIIKERLTEERLIKIFTDSENFEADIQIFDIECKDSGSSFSINCNDKVMQMQTQLLGKHNIINIALAVAAAIELGVEEQNIIEAVKEIDVIENRQQKIITSRGITIIDDSYNINPEGVKAALDTLKMFKGRKIVTVSGLVEMGKRERVCNELLGEWISEVADILVVFGSKHKDSIIKGASANLDSDSIYTVSTMELCKDLYKVLLKEGDTLLVLADLPTNYLI